MLDRCFIELECTAALLWPSPSAQMILMGRVKQDFEGMFAVRLMDILRTHFDGVFEKKMNLRTTSKEIGF